MATKLMKMIAMLRSLSLRASALQNRWADAAVLAGDGQVEGVPGFREVQVIVDAHQAPVEGESKRTFDSEAGQSISSVFSHAQIKFRSFWEGHSDNDGRRAQDSLFVATVEFDRFCKLRRQIGFVLSNALIEAMGRRLQRAIPHCILGRVGRSSIEFAFTAESVAVAGEELQALAELLERNIEIGGYCYHLTVSIGAVDIGSQQITDHTLDCVGAAVAEAQDRQKKFWIASDVADEHGALGRLSMMQDLRSAMGNGDLELHYQPKLCARSNTIESAEALLRWYHPVHGSVSTAQLIDVAEATGAIEQLTRWVVERAISDHAKLRALGRELTIYVNFSGVLLPNLQFTNWVIDRLAASQAAIGIEITETAVIEDPADAIANLNLLSKAGVKIAIDDYGAGLSSLAYLKQLPANELKIDRMFISCLTDSHRDPLLVRSTIDLAHALEMEVTAEGVDNIMTLSLLRVMGCDLIQGYLISVPLSFDDFWLFLSTDAHLALVSPPVGGLADWLTIASLSAGKVALHP